MDAYAIISQAGEGEYKDRGSKFLGFAHPVQLPSEALGIVAHYKKVHHKARHWCYAYRLGPDENNFRMNDDGEPSATAGKPILGQIDKLGLSDTLVVVVRYYGGVKLGTSGLIQAYREAAALALGAASLGQRQLTHTLRLRFTYELMGKVMQALDALQLEMQQQHFGEQARLDIEVARSEANSTKKQLLAKIAGIYQEEVGEEFSLEGLWFELL